MSTDSNTQDMLKNVLHHIYECFSFVGFMFFIFHFVIIHINGTRAYYVNCDEVEVQIDEIVENYELKDSKDKNTFILSIGKTKND